MFWGKKYILHSESDEQVNQLHFSNTQIIGLVVIFLILTGSFLLHNKLHTKQINLAG